MTEVLVKSLLPTNHEPIEHALEEAIGSRVTPLPVDRIRSVPLPLHCPPEFVAFAAWGDSADLWNPAWPLETRRVIADRALQDQAIKGSLELHARYLSYVGARLIRANTPHDYFVWGRLRTPAEEEAYLSRLPEIRIYPFALPRPAGKKLFFGARPSGRFFDAGYYLAGEDSVGSARHRHERRAVLIRDGVETALRIVEIAIDGDLAEWAMIPRQYQRGYVFGKGHVKRQRFFAPSRAPEFLAGFRRISSSTVRTVAGGGSSRALNPTLVYEQHQVSPFKAFWGKRRRSRVFFMKSVAYDHVFDRVRLYEPGALRASQKKSFFDFSYARRQTHTMVLSIEVAKPSPRRKFFWGGFLKGYFRSHDGRHLADALAAVRAASLPHEAILVDLETAFRRRFFGA